MTLQSASRGRPRFLDVSSAPGFWLGALTVFGALVRWIVARDEGIWRDEGLFLAIVRLPRWHDAIEFLQFHESHPPLFYAMVRAWLRMFNGSDESAILLVVLMGSLLIPAIYLAGKRLYTPRVGIVAAALATISPVLIDYAAMVRPYPLLQLLVLISTGSLALALHDGRNKWWCAFVISTLAMIYTHNWTWLIVAGHAIGFVVLVLLKKENRKSQILRGAVAAAFIMIVFAPWARTLVYQGEHAGYSPLDVDIWHVLFVIPFTLQATVLPGLGNPRQKLAVAYASTLFVVLIGLVLAYRRARRFQPPAGQAAVPYAGPVAKTTTLLIIITSATALSLALLLSPRSNLIQPRCLSLLTPLWLICLAAAGDRQWNATTRPAPRVALGLATAFLFGLYAGGVNRLVTSNKSNAREIAAAIEARLRPTDLIILLPEWLASSFNHYFQPANEQIDYPHDGKEVAVDFVGLMSRLSDSSALQRTLVRVNEARASGRRVWLISDWPNFISLDSLNAIQKTTKVAASFVVPLRVAQIRESLVRLYGGPDSTLVTDHSPDRYEHFIAYLFTPPDKAPAHSQPSR